MGIIASKRSALRVSQAPAPDLSITRGSARCGEMSQLSVVQAQARTTDAPELAGGQLQCTRVAPKRWRRRRPFATEVLSDGSMSQTVSKELPPWFSWLVYCTSFLWSIACGVYAIVAAAYYTNELTWAWGI